MWLKYWYVYIYEFMFIMWRDVGDGKCAHHNGGDRVRSAITSMGNSSNGMGGWTSRSICLLIHNILHFHSSCWLLPFPWPHPWQEKLHLFHGCQIHLRYIYRFTLIIDLYLTLGHLANHFIPFVNHFQLAKHTNQEKP